MHVRTHVLPGPKQVWRLVSKLEVQRSTASRMQVLRSVRAARTHRAGSAAPASPRSASVAASAITTRDCAAGGHGHDLPIDQSTFVSSFALMVTFSVFLPSSPCQISTS